MLKAELQERLTEALDHLAALAGHARLPKAARADAEQWIEGVRQELAQAEGSTPRNVWRIGEAISPKTGRANVLELRADGTLSPAEAARLGIEGLDEWTEVRAESRREALAKIEDGEGTRYRRTRSGNIREVGVKAAAATSKGAEGTS